MKTIIALVISLVFVCGASAQVIFPSDSVFRIGIDGVTFQGRGLAGSGNGSPLLNDTDGAVLLNDTDGANLLNDNP